MAFVGPLVLLGGGFALLFFVGLLVFVLGYATTP
jgi:hypothetical protein